ncbi:hypothetical protein GQ55_9G399700 [Panicum hallii var. hallii]|uniref:Uncharacterized protein n=1 Tax=Panicum hallii var. hallii TaxID=1504633 RepID=A0A2T7C9V8_9POAL|nr:hypothetical protein GQ55_9G399700 [Panicum hallii var. hallii]
MLALLSVGKAFLLSLIFPVRLLAVFLDFSIDRGGRVHVAVSAAWPDRDLSDVNDRPQRSDDDIHFSSSSSSRGASSTGSGMTSPNDHALGDPVLQLA